MNGIDNIHHQGGSLLNVGKALQYVRHNVFTSSTGSRRLESVPQILVLVCSKPSNDDVRGPAFALREHGITTISVGVGDKTDIEATASKPELTFKVADFSMLPSIQSDLSTSLNKNGDNEKAVTAVSDLTVTDTGTTKKDIVFIFDGTDNLKDGLPVIREFIRRTADGLDIDDDKVRVAVVQYSDDVTVHFYLNSHSSRRGVMNGIRSIRHKGGRHRNTGAALQFVRERVFAGDSGGRRLEGVPQVLFLLTGGKSADDVTGPVSELRSMGVVLLAIGLKGAKRNELEKMAFSSGHIFNIPVFGDLLVIQPEIAARVEKDMRVETSSMVDSHNLQRDFVFLLDGSDDTSDTFPSMKRLIQRLVETFNVDGKKDQVSVIQYSNNAQTHFSLDTYKDPKSVLTAVQKLIYKGGRPRNTGAAIDYVKTIGFDESSGSRHKEGIPQIMILLSGGRSNDDVLSAATALRQSGIVAFSVGTMEADILELQMISNVPSYTFSFRDFDDTGSLYQQLVSFLKRMPQQPRQPPPESLDQKHTTKHDVVFLLDSSDRMQNQHQAMIGFVERLVEKLNVHQDNDRVSVVQYSEEPAIEFLLNAYRSKQNVLNALRNLQHRGGKHLKTGEALKYTRENVFTPSSGSRIQEGVPQILVVLTGERSRDDVRNSAQNLREMGVDAYVVGTKTADAVELQSISRKANQAFIAADFSKTAPFENQILALIKQGQSSGEALDTASYVTDISGRDIVFLLDGADDSAQRFKDIKDFVKRVATKLTITANRDHVAVVQYSNTARTDFGLSRHTSQEEVLKAVDRLNHKGGSPRNIGAALHYVKNNLEAGVKGQSLSISLCSVVADLGMTSEERHNRSKIKE
ncbi:collagen alpha-3(VI) chain-like [Synchiropus picturatus]